MANEAVIIELTNGGNPIRRTVADGTTISKGTLLVMTDPNTVAASTVTSSASVFGGVAAADKLASDGSTTLAVWQEGCFDMTNAAFGTPSVGALVVLSGANLIRAAVAADLLTGAIIGKLEETAATNEVVRVRLGAN